MPRPPAPALLVALALALAGCGEGPPTAAPSPTPSPTPAPTPAPGTVAVGAHFGLTEITFVDADPAPGATVEGCGKDASGCAGRIRMRFRLRSASGGPVLDAIAFLHATNKLACLRGSSGPLTLAPGVAYELALVLDQADPACGLPATISDMKLVLSGPVETESRQEWGVRYELSP